MRGGATLIVADDDGRPHLRSAYAEPPFRVWKCNDRILLSASSAGPVGGDELTLDIDVLAGATAAIGAVASTIVLPSPASAPSTMTTTANVGPGAHLDWIGEPTVSVMGSDHTVATAVQLDETATCRIVEEISLGRSDEPPGQLRLVMKVDRGGAPLVRHDEVFGPHVPGAGSLVSVGEGGHVVSAILVGIDASEPAVVMTDGCRAAFLPIAADAAMLLAVGSDRPSTIVAIKDGLGHDLTTT